MAQSGLSGLSAFAHRAEGGGSLFPGGGVGILAPRFNVIDHACKGASPAARCPSRTAGFKTRMIAAPEPSTHPLTRAEWREWLLANHQRTTGTWLVSYKKATGKPRVEYDDAVEEALCFGWVDSKANKLDEERTLLWFAPRKPRTGWSRPNKIRIARLIEAGLMVEAGLRKVEQARADGSWTKLDGVEELLIPEDLGQALNAQPSAAEHFNAFPRSAKRGILEWIANAKTPATRSRRIDETARLASRNERANQWRPKPAA